MKPTTILSTVVLALALSIPTAFSADKKKDAAAEPAKKEEAKGGSKKDHYPLYGELLTLTDTALTVKGGEGKPDRTFNITKDTTIKKDGKPASFKDGVTGQWVGGYVKKATGDGNDEIVSLNLSAKQKNAKTDIKAEGAAEEKKPAEKPAKKKAA